MDECGAACTCGPGYPNRCETELFIDNLLVRIHFPIEIVWWTGLAPWEFKFPFPGSLIPIFLEQVRFHSGKYLNLNRMCQRELPHEYFIVTFMIQSRGIYLLRMDPNVVFYTAKGTVQILCGDSCDLGRRKVGRRGHRERERERKRERETEM